ncbi:MAG: DUF2842 domain-containing protein [Hyphomicrobiaceae bacterium]|nr:DUF2842 domain-containing protein [Hyphomicrobiaceae bacterium]
MIGTAGLVLFVIVYAFVSMLVAIAILPGRPEWQHLIYYMVAGCLWAFPAMPVIKWMMRPDPPQAT